MIYIPLYDNFKHLFIVGVDRTESNQIQIQIQIKQTQIKQTQTKQTILGP